MKNQKLLPQRTPAYPPIGVSYHKVSPIVIGQLKLEAVEDLDQALKAKWDAEREIERCNSFLDRLEDNPDQYIYFNEWYDAGIKHRQHEKLSL